MKIRVLLSALLLALISAAGVHGQSATTDVSTTAETARFVGVWQGELEGVPSVILTLGADDGTLQGTLVLNGINGSDGTPQIAVRETHALLHPKLSGTALSFSVKGRRGPRASMDFVVEQTSDTTATFHCLSCGDDAPTVEITKQD